MRIPIAIVFGSLLVAGAILFINRWDFRDNGLRIDRWTGAATQCRQTQVGRLDCDYYDRVHRFRDAARAKGFSDEEITALLGVDERASARAAEMAANRLDELKAHGRN